ncbi:hypothetical protein [Flectobacillus sp. BAB-3569]|uniref:hypothetical protein n=1 Tax=Flectobacillus sp. BAB-3569 TaxID=1509483 RepID=UPI000BA3FC91|nr:hypothetical protein [Flectobacillus sp. BAB-3569]PAC29229.1 hypothetical protein BWI92_16505 [Flectobacillus sp. BAB-3569]
MSLKHIALIVDGPTEEGSIRAKFNMLYQCCPEIRNGPGNGTTFSIEGYAKGVLPTLILLLKTDVRAIILIPDLEKRREKAPNFSKKMKAAISKLLLADPNFSPQYIDETIYVCPPDIMFENWIISDVEGIKNCTELIKVESVQDKFDGKNGSSQLQKIMRTKYKKTVHAKQLFKKTRESESADNSPSFSEFQNIFNKLKEKHCNT